MWGRGLLRPARMAPFPTRASAPSECSEFSEIPAPSEFSESSELSELSEISPSQFLIPNYLWLCCHPRNYGLA